MVMSGDREGGNKLIVVMGTTTTTPERSSSKPPLHNFPISPFLRWGNQRRLICRKVDSDSEDFDLKEEAKKFLIGQCRNDESLKKTPPPPPDGIEAVRAKLMLDLQTAADKLKFAISGEEDEGVKETTPSRPWNLRTRRASCSKALNGTFNGGASGGGGDVRNPNFPPLRIDDNGKSSRINGDSSTGKAACRPNFSVSLSRREIEEDFMLMAEQKPRRRPKKRPKVVQKQLDTIFPGLWLTEVTPDMYKVADAP